MQFVDAILETIPAERCIDVSRVFAAGFSWGADMTIELGCFRGDVFRAIHPFSGTGIVFNGCTTQTPAFRETIGADDPFHSLDAVNGVFEHFSTAQHCGSSTRPSTPSECVEYVDCTLPVVLCTYPGMGHDHPPNAGQDAWAFFRSL